MTYRRYQGFDLGPIGFLVVANLIIYIAVSINHGLISVFGLQPDGFLLRPWTLITSMFIHSPFPDFWHVVANMLALYLFGSYLVRLVGERNFLITYFCGGILGGIFYIFLASPFSIAIGASGAIFALGGALTVMRPNLRVFIIPIPVPVPLWLAVIGGFLVISPLVAWQAHLGGLLFGLVIGLFFRRKERRFHR